MPGTRWYKPILAVLALILMSVTGSATGQSSGTVTGTLDIGPTSTQLVYAYAFAEDPGAEPATTDYRILITDRPLGNAAIQYASTAGRNEGDRMQLALQLADGNVQGLEAIVAADNRVMRATVYGPDAVLGMLLLAPTGFERAALAADSISGRLFTENPIEDWRIGKTVQYDLTFSAPIHR